MPSIDFPFDKFNFNSDSILEGLPEQDLALLNGNTQPAFIILQKEKSKNIQLTKKVENKFFMFAERGKY
jgi:hypothetical protein